MPTSLVRRTARGSTLGVMQLAKRLAAVALVATVVPLAACSTPPPAEAHVVVEVAASARPQSYDVHLAQAAAGYRSEFALRPGQTRRVAIPAGWVTVRVAGLCVVPAPTTRTTTVEVHSTDCTIV